MAHQRALMARSIGTPARSSACGRSDEQAQHELFAAMKYADDREWRRLVDRTDRVVADAVVAQYKADIAKREALLVRARADLASAIAALPLHRRLWERARLLLDAVYLWVFDRVLEVRSWWYRLRNR
jgi:hypothetical protein